MNDKKEKEQGITRLQLYLLFTSGVLMVAYTSFEYGLIDSILGTIGGSVFISTILTRRFTERDENSSIYHAFIGGLVAGLFMLPPDLFLYLKDAEVNTVVFFLFTLVSIISGAIVGYLINYIPTKTGFEDESIA